MAGLGVSLELAVQGYDHLRSADPSRCPRSDEQGWLKWPIWLAGAYEVGEDHRVESSRIPEGYSAVWGIEASTLEINNGDVVEFPPLRIARRFALLQPADEGVIQMEDAILEWEECPGAAHFEVYIWYGSGGGFGRTGGPWKVEGTRVRLREYPKAETVFERSDTFLWHVTAIDAQGSELAKSERRTFFLADD